MREVKQIHIHPKFEVLGMDHPYHKFYYDQVLLELTSALEFNSKYDMEFIAGTIRIQNIWIKVQYQPEHGAAGT